MENTWARFTRLQVHTAVTCHFLAAAELSGEVAALIHPQLLFTVSGMNASSPSSSPAHRPLRCVALSRLKPRSHNDMYIFNTGVFQPVFLLLMQVWVTHAGV